ncbi:MAG: hypothetical protein KC549_15025 [Myxococcales bacterium]|nr:hypothetical protein [Myxococcales bacterium]MCB9545148.1 hypothetical protein [Myxococcales bacterium]
MLADLAAAEAALPALLQDAAGWRSLRIDYHPPVVERLFRPFGDGGRLSLHRAWPCAPEDALFHPHPWPSAMRIVSGRYRMIVGHGPGLATPPVAATLELAAGSTYTMTDPDAWHAIMPLGGPSLSIMVTGRPWARPQPVEPAAPLRPMDAADAEALLAAFQAALGT